LESSGGDSVARKQVTPLISAVAAAGLTSLAKTKETRREIATGFS
jgi:hypothetical protein